MPLIPVSDPDDPRLAPYRAVRERDVVGHGERFVAEGEVVLRLLIEGGRGAGPRFATESALIAENRADALGPLLAKLPDDVPVYVAGRAVMDAVVGFPIHRGVLAIGRRPAPLTPADLLKRLPERALVVALSGVSNHDNVGGIFRNAAAFGADAVLLDGACCDPLYRKAIRVSVGASLVLPFARGGSGAALLEALDAAGFATFALSPAGGLELGEVVPAQKTALLLGAEGPGLAPELMARARTVRVAMAGGFDSLNVATTSGVALYALARGRLA